MEVTLSNADIQILPEGESAPRDMQEPDANYDLILLDPAQITLFRTGGSIVHATITDPQIGAERSFRIVRVARAFPLSKEFEYIGLRNGDDKDIGMLQTLAGMEPESRRIVDEELNRRYFVPKVLRVNQLKEEFGNVTWTVETDKGERVFIVPNIREGVVEVSTNRVLVTDKDGVRYEFPDVTRYDAKTQALFTRVL